MKQTYFLHFSQLYMLSPVKKKMMVSNEMGLNYHIKWIFSLKGSSLKLWNRRLFIVRVQNTLKRRPCRLLKCKILSKKFEQNFRTPSLQWCYLELLWRISNQCRRCYYICDYENPLVHQTHLVNNWDRMQYDFGNLWTKLTTNWHNKDENFIIGSKSPACNVH